MEGLENHAEPGTLRESNNGDLLEAKHNLAKALRASGESSQAERLYREVIKGHSELLQLGTSLVSLLYIYIDQQAALLPYIVFPGESDLLTLRAKLNLAVLLTQNGEHAEAKSLYQEVGQPVRSL